MVKRSEESVTSVSSTSKENGGSPRLKWANVYLDANQKEASKLMAANADKVDSLISTLLADGYSVSMSFNEETDSYIVTFLGKRCGGANEGWAMTTHAGTWYEALCRSLYKHFILGAELSYSELGESFGRQMP